MKIDFTGVESSAGSFEPLPPGVYQVTVDDYKESKAGENAKNPGAPIISWMLRVDEDHPKFPGRVVWDNMAIIPPSDDSKGTLWRVKGFLEACGFEVGEDEIDFEPEEVLGSSLKVRLGVDKGRTNKETGEPYPDRNTVKGFSKVG